MFTARSLATMFHGMVLGGGALIALAAALFTLRVLAMEDGAKASPRQTSCAKVTLARPTSVTATVTVSWSSRRAGLR